MPEEIYQDPNKKTVEETNKPSKLWYLLPIFLSIIGGIAGYLVIKNRKTARNLLITGVVVLIIQVVFVGLNYTSFSQFMALGNVSGNKTGGNQSMESLCTSSGGTVTNMSCCQTYGDFPSKCLIAPCACSPDLSHEVKGCDCKEGNCWDSTKGCIKI